MARWSVKLERCYIPGCRSRVHAGFRSVETGVVHRQFVSNLKITHSTPFTSLHKHRESYIAGFCVTLYMFFNRNEIYPGNMLPYKKQHNV